MWLVQFSRSKSETFKKTLSETQRGIVGGSSTSIENYPYVSALLYLSSQAYVQTCVGTIINNRAILSAAHCFYGHSASSWRIRVGSSYANSGGTVFTTAQIIIHPSYTQYSNDNDVAIMHSSAAFTFSNSVRAAGIAGTNYNVADNQALWSVGWGKASSSGSFSEQLRHFESRSINLSTCQSIYVQLAMYLTDNMMCSGWLNASGNECQGISGGPLVHNSVIVGIHSWGAQCQLARYPGISTRVSAYTSWIQSNA
ncbi:unnamed protein product [Parnassius apollo]|uniref:(apollo) hypothetical protein n=1 Tax=Parnassius apollo TaxID=110799 RepID=A0A8S3WR81_PARAO|nr:unnamed protein product [Parnassius apollo]